MNELTRKELFDMICLADATCDCVQGECSTYCDKCEEVLSDLLDRYDKKIQSDERTKVATEILADIESFCKDNTRQSFNWSEVWLGLWKILKEKYGVEH